MNMASKMLKMHGTLEVCNMNEELKACPFCGAEPNIYIADCDVSPDEEVIFTCSKCFITFTFNGQFMLSMAMYTWNKRA